MSATRRRMDASKYRDPHLSQTPIGTSSRMTKPPLCRSASRSTRRSRTVPSQCSQVKLYMADTSLYFVNGNDQELIVLNKTNHHADGRFLVSAIANDHVACATRIHCQHL